MAVAANTWKVEFHSGIPVYMQIIHQVKEAIAAGRLSVGDQLPTIRALHQQLDVNPNTVAKAYRELAHMGLVSAEHGSGCYVSEPPGGVPRLSARETREKAQELSIRFAAEARSHGIPLDQIIQQLNHQKSNA